MNNVIRLRSVYGKVNQKYFLQPSPNPKTGQFPLHVKSVNSNGDIVLSESEKEKVANGEVYYIKINEIFEFEDGKRFDLDDLMDNSIWEAIEHSPLIAPSRGARDDNGELIIDGNRMRYGSAELYVEREGEMAKAKVSKAQLINKAQNYIFADTHEEKIRKCKVLGRNLENANPADIEDYMIELSQKDPKKIINIYEDESWKMHLFILTAIERGVIRKINGLYIYGDDKTLGGSIEAAISLLKDIRYRAIYNAIKKETYPEYETQEKIDEMKADLSKDVSELGDEKDKTKINKKK